MQFTPKRILRLVAMLLLFALPLFAVVYRQQLYDWWQLRQYDPPAEIEAIVKRTTMNHYGQKIFFVAHPELSNQQTFNEQCHIEEFSIILGCYIPGQGIYLYDIQDKRLSGIIEVTAAHEMLHAAYDRLSSSERARVNSLLSEAFKKVSSARIKQTVKQYESQGAEVVANELHSILGSEVRTLPEELEAYYTQYFNDRQEVVKFSEQYEQEFSSRQNRVNQMDHRLEALKQDIEANQSSLEGQERELVKDRGELEALRSNGNIAAYNAGVDAFNAKVGAYNNLVATTRSLIAEYNDLVRQRNKLAVEVQDLVEAIDSTPERFN